jgi:hypothetical protein
MSRPLIDLWPFAWRALFLVALLPSLQLPAILCCPPPPGPERLLQLAWLPFFLTVGIFGSWRYWRLGLFAWRVRRFRTWAGGKVVLHYEAGLETRWDFLVLQQGCEAVMQELTGQFGPPLRRPLVVYLFARWRDISRVFGPGYAGAALSLAHAVVIADDTVLHELLRHEIAHLFSARWNKLAPPLLSEGLSTWLPGTWGGRPVDAVAGQLLDNAIPRLPALVRRRFFFSAARRQACYVLAGSFTGFLVRRFGWDSYRRFFRRANGWRFPSAFRRSFGVSLSEAEVQWKQELLARRTSRPFPALLPGHADPGPRGRTQIASDGLKGLERRVFRFCAQLEREGYRVNRERVGDVHVIEARERRGQAVVRYVAALTGDGVRIDEIDGPQV